MQISEGQKVTDGHNKDTMSTIRRMDTGLDYIH